MIADITGYSRFLNESELAHAQQTLSSLMELLVDHTRPPLVVSKLEGDAVLSYGVDGDVVKGQAFSEALEMCYVEFRKALELMVLNTTCTCNACANISALDLKFLVHHGEFILGETAGRTEMYGADVNLVHRLLKNTVTEKTGIRAYLLYTAQAIEGLGLQAQAASMTTHTASYPDVGSVTAFVTDLDEAWMAVRNASATVIDPDEVVIEVASDVRLPIDVVWGYLIDPEFRKTLLGSDRQELVNTSNGRAGEGSVYQCYHGDRLVSSLIVEWQPLQRMLTRDTTRMFGSTVVFPVEYELEPILEGTRVVQRGLPPEASWPARSLVRAGFRFLRKQFQRYIDSFRDRIQDDYAKRR